MSETNATVAYQRPPFLYGEVLSASVYQSPRNELPGIGRFLSQGVAAGAGIYFLVQLAIILSQPNNGYNVLYIILLPFVLVWGMVLGLFEGLVIWAGTKLAGHRLNAAARSALGIVVLLVLFGLLQVLRNVEVSDSRVILIYLSTGVAYGLVTGSRLQPWRELVRGAQAIPAQSRLLTGITGIVLRVIVVWWLMESILAFICTLQGNFNRKEVVIVSIALAHFAAASVIVFARMKFWLLLPLALLVNFPLAPLITEKIFEDAAVIVRYVTISYFAVWAAFLITRWSSTYSALAVLKEEIRYYLID